jgi:hypothetical protein
VIVGECGVGISSIFSPSRVIFCEEVVIARMVKIKYTFPLADMEEPETRIEDMYEIALIRDVPYLLKNRVLNPKP